MSQMGLVGSYDVGVIGAGPGGAFLAYLLARRGVRVLVIDKEVFPRDKVCGGGISNKTIQLLPFSIEPVVQKRITGAYLTYRNRDTIYRHLDDGDGAAVLRSEFDNFLIERAVEAGAIFLPGVSLLGIERVGALIHISTSGGEFKARYLVGADGAASTVRAQIFGKEIVSLAPAVEALVSVRPEDASQVGDRMVFDFGGMPRGYGWIFPKKDHLNVGVFSMYPVKSIKRCLADFMSNYRILKSPLSIRYKGYVIPLSNDRGIYESNNCFLIGDAAGFAESFYGEGIYFALKSAALLDEALATSFDRPGDRAYSQLVARHLSSELKYSTLNAKLFYPIQRFGFYHMVRNIHVNNYFAGLINGNVTHRQCFYKTILTSPYWLFSRRFQPADIERL